jgi:hypothetical protein
MSMLCWFKTSKSCFLKVILLYVREGNNCADFLVKLNWSLFRFQYHNSCISLEKIVKIFSRTTRLKFSSFENSFNFFFIFLLLLVLISFLTKKKYYVLDNYFCLVNSMTIYLGDRIKFAYDTKLLTIESTFSTVNFVNIDGYIQ